MGREHDRRGWTSVLFHHLQEKAHRLLAQVVRGNVHGGQRRRDQRRQQDVIAADDGTVAGHLEAQVSARSKSAGGNQVIVG